AITTFGNNDAPDPKIQRCDNAGANIWTQSVSDFPSFGFWAIAISADGTFLWIVEKDVSGPDAPTNGYLFRIQLSDGAILAYTVLPDLRFSSSVGGAVAPFTASGGDITGLTIDCENEQISITGTGLDAGALTIMGPDGSSLSFTVVSATSTLIVITLDDGFAS